MFLEYLLHSDAFEAAAPRLRRGAAAYAPSFFAPYVLAGRDPCAGERGWLVVAPDGEAAAKLATDLALYLDRPVPVLPARGVLYGADVAPAAHVVGERQQALAALAAGGVVVAEAVALLERFLPLELQPRAARADAAAAPSPSTTPCAGLAAWATSASSRCAGAASSPYAAASSTCTRRSATRCASSSGATRSTLSAPSRSTRSARSGTLDDADRLRGLRGRHG